MRFKHDTFMSVHVMRLAGVMVACLLAVSGHAATTYTWTGATDGDWSNAGNWDGNGVPVDNLAGTGFSAGLSLPPGDSIVFDGGTTPLPTSNIPDLGGNTSPYDTPSIVIKQGGSLALTLGGREGAVWSNQAGNRNVLTVGDGMGPAGEVTVSLGSIVSNPNLSRHASSVLNNFQVNSDGILNLTSATVDFGYNDSRHAKITIDGGEVTLSGVVEDISSYAARIIEFTATHGSFTANYGGDFADITAVSNRLFYDFTFGAGITGEAIDNGTSFTVTSVVFTGTSVSVIEQDAAAAEEGSDPGTLSISRGSKTNGNLVVYYTFGGTADTNDYTETHSSPVTIPDGTNSVDLVFTPVDDLVYEGTHTVQLTITPDAAYAVASPSLGTITITDNDTLDRHTIADGNWTNAATWDAGVPGEPNIAYVNHHVTIDSDVGKVDKLKGDGNGTLTMNGGMLDVDDGDWTSIPAFSLTNGATLDFNQFARAYGTWTVDGSSLLFGTDAANWKQVELRSDWDCTIRKGSTFWSARMSCSGNGTQIITSEGAGNTLYGGSFYGGADTGNTTFKLVMGDTDAALSTWSFDTLDLDLGTRSWNLVVDATKWNGAKTVFTLFDADTLTGEFDNVQLIGMRPEAVSITYDRDSGDIVLDATPEATILVIR